MRTGKFDQSVSYHAKNLDLCSLVVYFRVSPMRIDAASAWYVKVEKPVYQSFYIWNKDDPSSEAVTMPVIDSLHKAFWSLTINKITLVNVVAIRAVD
jgi:hypothetical protein